MNFRPRLKFTVGWIAAIDREYLAARQVLDAEYRDFDLVRHTGDHNVYTFGRIGDHHVVIATLPRGTYGTHSAAAVADGLKASFPLLRFVLMVGVAGGAPKAENDVRLGDVVVGNRMVPYSFGKQLPNGHQYTGNAIMSDPELLSATTTVEGKLWEGTLDLDSMVSQKYTKTQKIKDAFRRPEDGSDRLYRSEYVHTDFCDCLSDHSQDLEALVVRKKRKEYDRIKVHCGTIGSADTVLKDAIERDHLIEKFGVLCFEMESAGLMPKFPCLPIRGICDYSDSHKNKQWQGYAAAVAAVYAQTLLHTVSPANSSQVNSSINLDDVRNEIHLVVQSVGQVTSRLDERESGFDQTERTMRHVQDTVAILNQFAKTSSGNINQLDAQVDQNTNDIELHRGELHKLKEGQKDMQESVVEMTKHIKEQIETSPDEQKPQWGNLHEQAERQTVSLVEVAESTSAALNSTAGMLDDVNKVAGNNPIVGKVAQGMKLSDRTPDLTKKLRDMTRLKPSNGEKESRTEQKCVAQGKAPEAATESDSQKNPSYLSRATQSLSRLSGRKPPRGTNPGPDKPQLPSSGAETPNGEIPGAGVAREGRSRASQEELRNGNGSSTEMPPPPPLPISSNPLAKDRQSQAAQHPADSATEPPPYENRRSPSVPSVWFNRLIGILIRENYNKKWNADSQSSEI